MGAGRTADEKEEGSKGQKLGGREIAPKRLAWTIHA